MITLRLQISRTGTAGFNGLFRQKESSYKETSENVSSFEKVSWHESARSRLGSSNGSFRNVIKYDVHIFVNKRLVTNYFFYLLRKIVFQ